jgi:aspartyl aminopeptidase
MAISDVDRLLEFLNNSPSPWHCVDSLRKRLNTAGFLEIKEQNLWNLNPGQSYFVCRNNTSLFAFKTPEKPGPSMKSFIVGAHTDSPCLRIKPNPNIFKEGYHLIDVEVYGGALWNSWLDRILGFAGNLVYTKPGSAELHQKLVRSEPLFKIPQLAIHLDRGVNENGLKLNPQEHLSPLVGMDKSDSHFLHYLESHLDPGEKLIDWDLCLYNATPAQRGGLQGEFIFGARQDNLNSVHAATEALCDVEAHPDSLLGIAFFNHEEIGSESATGAGSDFISHAMERIWKCLGFSREQQLASLSDSLFISTDMAHAVHPSYAEKHGKNQRPRINNGPVIKRNVNMRYATDAHSSARFKQICQQTSVPWQEFSSRNDIGCGSTIGPIIATNLGMPVVDIGNPLLSMHSINETGGSLDHELMIRVLRGFFNQNRQKESSIQSIIPL